MEIDKKTLVIGASTNPARYSYLAIQRLVSKNVNTVAAGLREGIVEGVVIKNDLEIQSKIHTVTLYVGQRHMPYWEDFILAHNPKRIIFNPGTENSEFENKARNAGIDTVLGCTLVMLSTNTF